MAKKTSTGTKTTPAGGSAKTVKGIAAKKVNAWCEICGHSVERVTSWLEPKSMDLHVVLQCHGEKMAGIRVNVRKLAPGDITVVWPRGHGERDDV